MVTMKFLVVALFALFISTAHAEWWEEEAEQKQKPWAESYFGSDGDEATHVVVSESPSIFGYIVDFFCGGNSMIPTFLWSAIGPLVSALFRAAHLVLAMMRELWSWLSNLFKTCKTLADEAHRHYMGLDEEVNDLVGQHQALQRTRAHPADATAHSSCVTHSMAVTDTLLKVK